MDLLQQFLDYLESLHGMEWYCQSCRALVSRRYAYEHCPQCGEAVLPTSRCYDPVDVLEHEEEIFVSSLVLRCPQCHVYGATRDNGWSSWCDLCGWIRHYA